MALFLGGGRPLLAGIMTLVMVQPLTSSDTPGEAQVWYTRRGSSLKSDTPEKHRKRLSFDQIGYSRKSENAEDQERLKSDTPEDQRNTSRCWMYSLDQIGYSREGDTVCLKCDTPEQPQKKMDTQEDSNVYVTIWRSSQDIHLSNFSIFNYFLYFWESEQCEECCECIAGWSPSSQVRLFTQVVAGNGWFVRK